MNAADGKVRAGIALHLRQENKSHLISQVVPTTGFRFAGLMTAAIICLMHEEPILHGARIGASMPPAKRWKSCTKITGGSTGIFG